MVRGTVRVKCLVQEHNTISECPRPGLEPGPLDPESSVLAVKPQRKRKGNMGGGTIKRKGFEV